MVSLCWITMIIKLILSAGVFSTVNSGWNVKKDKLIKISIGNRLICNVTCAIMIISCSMLSHRWTTIIISLILSAGEFLTVNPEWNVTRDKLIKISLGYRLICNETCVNMIISCLMLSLRLITMKISLIHTTGVFPTVDDK